MMTRRALILLSILNVGLLFMSILLTWQLGALGENRLQKEMTFLTKEREQLAGERARMESRVSLLAAAVARLEDVVKSTGHEATSTLPPVQPPVVEDPEVTAHLAREGLETKPNPLALPILSEEEMLRHDEYCRKFPNVDYGALREGDMDVLLSEPSWLPEQDRERVRSLDALEQKELHRLVSEFRYFAKFSAIERYRAMVAPEIPHLREEGAYVEFESSAGAPTTPGIHIAHAEQIEGQPNRFRLYQFHPDDYPLIYYHEKVSQQRTLEAMARICEFLYDDHSR